MATSAKTPLWQRLLIVLSAVLAGIVAASLIGQAGASWVPTIAAGAAVTLLALWLVARLLHVRLKRGWE